MNYKDSSSSSQFIEVIPPCFLTIVSFIIRYLSAPWTPTTPDSYAYLKLSQNITEGKYYIETWARGEFIVKPLYSILINIFSWPSNNIEYGATWVSILAGSLLILPLYFLSKWIAGRPAAILACLFAIFSPQLVSFSNFILTESMYTFILLMIIAAGFWMLKSKRPFYVWLLLGVLVGISLMSRDVAMIAVPVFAAWIIANSLTQGVKIRRTAAYVTLFVIGIIIFKMSYTVLQTGQDIKPRPTGEMIIKKLTAPDLRDSAEREKYFSMLTDDASEYRYEQSNDLKEGIFQVIWDYRGEIIKKFFINLIGHIEVLWRSFPLLIIILCAAGLIRNIYFGEGLLSRYYLISWVLVFVLFYVAAGAYTSAVAPMSMQRYLIPLFPILYLWVGMGIMWISDIAGKMVQFKFGRKIVPKYIVIFLLSFWIITLFVKDVIAYREYSSFIKNREKPTKFLGELIAKRNPDSLIMVRLPEIPYYAKASWLIIPDEPIDRLIKFARHKKVNFIIIDSDYTLQTRQQLIPLLRNDAKVEGLKQVLKVPHPEGEDYLLLAVYVVE